MRAVASKVSTWLLSVGKQKRMIAVAFAIFIAASVFILAVTAKSTPKPNSPADDTANSQPAFSTVAPVDNTIQQLGGWERVSPPDKAPAYAYKDTIDGVSVKITQQALPLSFKNNTAGEVAGLAQKFNATNEIEAGDTTLHIGTSAKGPQSVIFTKKDLLILMKSQKKIADESWATYVQSLQPTKLHY